MMKKFYVLFLMLLACAGVSAQNDNHKISYQAVVRNAANQLMYDTDLTVAVELANSENGPAVYAETHAVHSNANGLISLLIGDGTYVSGSWDAIHWNAAWVKATISKSGTTLAVHHLPLTAVPFALYADQVNPAALADYLTENHYLTEEVQVLSISHDTVFLTGGSFVKLPAGFSGNYNDLTNKPDLDQYATNAHLNDTLGHYPTTQTLKDTATAIRNDFPVVPENVSAFNNDAGYLTKDSAVITNLQGDVTNLQGDVTTLQGDVTHLQEATRKDALCDSVEACVKGWISDSTRMVFDSLHTYYVNTNTLRDTAAAIRGDIPDVSGFATKDELRADSTALHNALRDTAAAIRSDIPDVSGFATKDELRADSTVLANRIETDSTVLANRIVTDSTALVNRIVTDSTALHNALKDTASAIRADFPEVSDKTITVKQGDNTIGTFTLNQGTDGTVIIPTPAEQAQSDWKENNASDPAYIRNKPNIRDSVNRVVLDSLSAANSTMNRAVDTIVRNNIHDSLDVIRTKIHTDSLDLVNRIVTDSTALADKMHADSLTLANRIVTDSTALVNRIVADSNALAHRMDTLLNHVCDSVQECVTGWISDSTRMVYDSLHTYYVNTNT
nr:hypothetical protein [Bacteroidales bacterium]